MNVLTLFSRARAGLNLTPSERALLKLIEGIIITALVAVCTQVAALASSGTLEVNRNTLLLLAGSFVTAVFAALHKLSSASGDPLLSAVVSAAESELGRVLPLHQQPVPPVATPAPAPVVAAPVDPAAPAPSAI